MTAAPIAFHGPAATSMGTAASPPSTVAPPAASAGANLVSVPASAITVTAPTVVISHATPRIRKNSDADANITAIAAAAVSRLFISPQPHTDRAATPSPPPFGAL